MISELSPSRVKLLPTITLFISIIFGVAGHLLLKNTMSSTELFTWFFFQQLVLALSVYSLGVLNWILTLQSMKLSVAYPLTSLNYVGILWGSYYFFNEPITIFRILGVGLVFIGILLVAFPAQIIKNY